MENISFELKDLYKIKDYKAVVEYHNNLSSSNEYNEWAYFYIINSLYKLNQFEKVIDLGKECLSKYNNFYRIKNTIGWAIYQSKLKKFDKDIDDINIVIKGVDYIVSICNQEEYSPYEIAIQRLIKIIYEKPNHQINYELGNKYLDLLLPDKLSDEEKVTEVDGTTRKLASDKENWYGKKSKTLFALERYNECLQITEEALKSIKNFHNRSDKWLRYRQGCCFIGLKDYKTANEIFEDLLKSFSHWCIYEKLYQIEKVNRNYEEAMKNASIAALTDREHKLRISMYEDMGDYLKSNGFTLEAEYHYRLVILLREEEGWKENKRVEAIILNNDVKEADKKTTLKFLGDFWRKNKYANVTFLEGYIDRIMDGNRSGFIRDDNGKSYYFRVNNFARRVNLLNYGQKVKFTLKESFDTKRNQSSFEAIDIEFIKNN